MGNTADTDRAIGLTADILISLFVHKTPDFIKIIVQPNGPICLLLEQWDEQRKSCWSINEETDKSVKKLQVLKYDNQNLVTKWQPKKAEETSFVSKIAGCFVALKEVYQGANWQLIGIIAVIIATILGIFVASSAMKNYSSR